MGALFNKVPIFYIMELTFSNEQAKELLFISLSNSITQYSEILENMELSEEEKKMNEYLIASYLKMLEELEIEEKPIKRPSW